VLQVPSLPDWIDPTVQYLRSKALLCGACEQARAGKLMLALLEALTNSIIHGNLEVDSKLKEQEDAFARLLAERAADPRYASRQVTIEVAYDGDCCRWALTDQGRGFDFERVLNRPPADEAELWLPSGRGILLMKALVDEVRYEQGGRRVVLGLWRGPEKRRHPRTPVQQSVRVVPLRADGSPDWPLAESGVAQNLSASGMAGVAQNLSASGIAILQARLASSDRVLIGLETGGQPVFLPAQVRHCRTLDGGLVELGCQFVAAAAPPAPAAPLGVEEAVADLLNGARARQSPPGERRLHPRAGYAERIEIHSPGGGPPLHAYTRNLSRGGIAFIATEPIALEGKVLVLPQIGQPPLRVRAVVVRCARITDGFYDVGAQFQALEE
jgi:anti-sigma regulatory factor (Ser/Thr protein kinase)